MSIVVNLIVSRPKSDNWARSFLEGELANKTDRPRLMAISSTGIVARASGGLNCGCIIDVAGMADVFYVVESVDEVANMMDARRLR